MHDVCVCVCRPGGGKSGYLRECWGGVGPVCGPVVLHLRIVDNSHCACHGEEFFELVPIEWCATPTVGSGVRRKVSALHVLPSIQVCLLYNIIHHFCGDHLFKKLER